MNDDCTMHLDAALTALSLIEAGLDLNNEDTDALLEPWLTNITPVLQYLIWLSGRLLSATPGLDPHDAIDGLRNGILEEIAQHP